MYGDGDHLTPCSGTGGGLGGPRNSQAALQHPYVLISLSVMFVLLALSMFGLYTPYSCRSSLPSQLSGLSSRQQGSVAGVAIMGMISGLVCSPAPRRRSRGALIYVAPEWQTSGSVAAVLYALSLGMGLPCCCSRHLGGRLRQGAGAWMDVIKQPSALRCWRSPSCCSPGSGAIQITTLPCARLGLALCAYLHRHNQHPPFTRSAEAWPASPYCWP